MKNKALTICLFILFALPIPVALLGGVFSVLWFLGSVIKTISFPETVLSFLGVILGFGYPITYFYSLNRITREKKVSVKTFYPAFHCLIAFVYLISLNSYSLKDIGNPVILSLPKYESSDCYYGEGFQDYTDYCKYYYSSNDIIVEELKHNEYFKLVTVGDEDEIKSYFADFENWVEHEKYNDKYDFSTDCINAGDYFYIENKETFEKYKDYPDNYSAYNVYFFDVGTKTLYYIHTNI